MNKITQEITRSIASISDPSKAQWLINYVKHDIKSRGVGIPEIRKIVIGAQGAHQLTKRPLSEQMEILNGLMGSEYTEDKLAAILYIQLFWKGSYTDETLLLISEWFDNELIFDWNVCDWLCVRILTPMIDASAALTIPALRTWNTDLNLWKARASLVPFAQCKTIGIHKDIVHEFSAVLIQRQERFCKTAVGWVLREFSRIDRDFVTAFLSDYGPYTTPEVVKNATKYITRLK